MEKILIVEDNEFNRIMLTRRLELKKYEVICAVDGQEGIDLAKLENPDFQKLADAYGLNFYQAKSADQLNESIKKSFKINRPSFIEVPVGPMPRPW